MFKHVSRHADSEAPKLGIGYPYIIFRILADQKPSIVTSANISSGPPFEIRLNYKLFGGRHKSDTTPSTEVPECDSSSDDSLPLLH